jgi:hypothetical protein
MLFRKKVKNLKPARENPEYARVINWVPIWSGGAPLPHIFSNGSKVCLVYHIQVTDPEWDGVFTTSIDANSDTAYPLALVEFSGHTFRFGIANDEVFSGLPLWGNGLVSYEAHIIENSKWIEELKQIHKIHPYYNEQNWKDLKHYMLLFKDEIFEVIAEDFKIETFNMSFEALAAIVMKRMYRK